MKPVSKAFRRIFLREPKNPNPIIKVAEGLLNLGKEHSLNFKHWRRLSLIEKADKAIYPDKYAGLILKNNGMVIVVGQPNAPKEVLSRIETDIRAVFDGIKLKGKQTGDIYHPLLKIERREGEYPDERGRKLTLPELHIGIGRLPPREIAFLNKTLAKKLVESERI